MSKRYSKFLPVSIFIFDLMLLNIALAGAIYIIRIAGYAQHITPIFSLLINLSWVIVSLISKSYDIVRPLVLKDNVKRFLLTVTYHLVLVMSIIYFFRVYVISRPVVLLAYFIFLSLVITSRAVIFFCLDYYRTKGYNHRKILVIGEAIIADRLIRSFTDHQEYGYDLLGFIDEEEVIANRQSVYDEILSNLPHEIFVCYKNMDIEFLNELVKIGTKHSIKINVVSDLFLTDSFVKLVNYNDIPVLQVISEPDISRSVKILKRGFDLTFSIMVMTAGAPLFAVLYVITKISSPGPAFYSQERIGRNHKPFKIYKFRSMYVNAEHAGPQLSKDNDVRITKWGLVMRKMRLDEFPQFFNVLKGEMSIVGPRPERQHFIEKIIKKMPGYKKLLQLKPGITSMGQVSYGYAEDVDQMCDRVKFDLLYLNNVNLNYDLGIILKTVKVMVQAKGK